MELDEELNDYPGRLPDYGAIFLSNSATKKECLRRKVFGLPSSCCSFVNQIKAGMILFLFEYEKRELYGVFQACSDGAMNIAPHAFGALGKHCPAQVKITLLWNCSPLPEKEFRDAIKGNYYSAKKFNLGLSEVQVKRLLQLFSLRRLEGPQRQVPRSKYAKKNVHSTGKPSQVDDGRGVGNNSINEQRDSVVTNKPAIQKAYQGYSSCCIGRVPGTEDNRSPKNVWVRSHCERNSELGMDIRNGHTGDISGKTRRDKEKFGSCKRVRNESDVDIYLGSADTTDYPLSDKVGRDGDEFVMSRLVRNEHCMDTDIGKALSDNYLGYPFGEVRRIPVADRLSISDKFQSEGINGNCFGAGVLTEYPSSFQSDIHTSIFSRKQRLVANSNSLVPDNVKSSFTVGHQMGQQPSCLPTSSYDVIAANSLVPNETNSTFTFGHQTGQQPSNLPYTTSYGDATVVSTLPHNSNAYSLGYQPSSLNKVNNSFSFEKCHPHYDYDENVTSRNQPYSLHMEPEGMNQRLDQISRFRDHISSTSPVHIEDSCHGTGMALPQAVYSEELNANSLRNQCYSGIPSSMFTLEHVPLDRQWGLTGSSSSGPTSCLVPLQSRGTRISARENKVPSASSYHHSLSVYPSLEDDFGHLVAPEEQLEHRTAWREENEVPIGRIPLSDEDQFEMQGNFYEDDSFKYELEHSQKSDRINLGRQKSRSSVFSRLALASDIYSPETNSLADCEASAMSTSVDEVMGMLHKNCHEWVKLKKSKQWCKQNDDAEDLKSKNRTSVSLKSVHCSNDDAEGLKKKKRTSVSLKSVHGSCKQNDDAEDLKKINRTSGSLESVQGGCKQNDAAGDLKKKKLTSVSLKSEQGCLKLVAKDMKEVRTPVGEERAARLTESTSFLNFRRRSETRKVNDKSCDESAGNEGLLGLQRKKRKLVRPSFSKNDSFGDKCTNSCASLTLYVLAKENLVGKDSTGGSEALIGSQENRTKVPSQGVKVRMVSLLHNEDGNPNTERRETRVESDIGVKESSNGIGLQNAKIPVRCEDQNPDTVMDSVYNDTAGSGLSQASHMTSPSVVLEVSMQVLKANAENDGDKHSELELLPSAHSADPAAM
ncbi:hypothetical protein UlMin_019271, partial [Ulmus minor]